MLNEISTFYILVFVSEYYSLFFQKDFELALLFFEFSSNPEGSELETFYFLCECLKMVLGVT